MKRFFALCTVLLFGGSAAFGYTNILDNGAGLTITNGWDAAGDMIVGSSTPYNALEIAAGGSLTNADAYVGQQAGASSNSVMVSGSGAEWITAGTLTVGAAGNSNNVVSVGSGGFVEAGDLSIAAGSDFNLDRNGTLELAGDWDASSEGFNWGAGGTLSVGGALSGLTVTNEGVILSGERTLVLDGGELATTNHLIIGYGNSGSTLILTNGATVGNADGYIGYGAGSEDNAVLVAGAGSAWTNEGNLTVASGNSLTVTNAAWVFVGGADTNLLTSGGGMAVAAGGHAVVEAEATILTDGVYIDPAGALELDGALTVTGDFDADQTGFSWNDGGALTVAQALTFTGAVDGTNKLLRIDGGSWNRGGDLLIDGSGNRLAVINGGALTNDNASVAGDGNTAIVTGAGSIWLNNGSLSITGSGNSVTVTNGGRITADLLSIADGNAFNLGSGGTLAMTGGFNVATQTNISWTSGGNLAVGGLLEGMTVASNLPVADAEYLSGARHVTLDGGSWAAGDRNLITGYNDDLNRLVITNGGSAGSASGFVGWGAGADLNAVVVQTGGAWANRDGLYVGLYYDAQTNLVQAGVENRLTVEDGGWVYVGEGRVAGPSGGLVVASTNGAELVVGGSQSAVEVAQAIYVGTDAAVTGAVEVRSGGSLAADQLLIADNSAFDLYGSLAVAGDFNAAQNGFQWYDGADLSVGGDLTGINTLDGTNRTLRIDGGTWDTSAADLYITGTGNLLAITNGAVVDSASAFIGLTENDVDNTVLVSDAQWNLSDDLMVSAGNRLAFSSNGVVSIGGNMTVSNAAVEGAGSVLFGAGDNVLNLIGADTRISTNVLFDGGGGADTVAVTDSVLVFDAAGGGFAGFETLAMTNSLLSAAGTLDLFDSIALSGGRLVLEGDTMIDGAFSASGTVLDMDAGLDTLTFTNSGGTVDLSGMTARISVSSSVAPSGLNELIIASADGFAAGGFAATNVLEYFLLYDFVLTNDASTISVTSTAAQDGELSAAPAYAGIEGVRSGFNRMQGALFARTRQLRRNAVATDAAVDRRSFVIPAAAPDGPQGPGDDNKIFGMHFWAEQFSGQGDYDTAGVSDGFVLNNNGTTFGLDRLFGDALVGGLGYTYARTAATSIGNDRVDTESYWLSLYGEWFGWEEYYVKGMLGAGTTDYTSIRREGLYEGLGRYSGSAAGGQLEAGRYIHRGNWAMVPYAGLQYLEIDSDPYTETDVNDGNEVQVDGQRVTSLHADLGLNLRHRLDTRIGRIQTVGYAAWSTDLINDSVDSVLSGDGVTVTTARIQPGADIIKTGLGLSWTCTEYLEVGLGYDGRFNEDYEEHIGSAMLEVRF